MTAAFWPNLCADSVAVGSFTVCNDRQPAAGERVLQLVRARHALQQRERGGLQRPAANPLLPLRVRAPLGRIQKV